MKKCPKGINIILLSNSTLFFEGIKKVFESEKNINIILETSEIIKVKTILDDVKPDFIICDSRTVLIKNRKFSRYVGEISPKTVILLFACEHKENNKLDNTIYVSDSITAPELVDVVLNKNVTSISYRIDKRPVEVKNKLTKTELKVINFISEGYTNKEAAKKLTISEKTVKAHLTNIFIKLNLKNRYQLIVYSQQINQKQQLATL